MEQKDHWEKVYATKPEDQVSWFQEHAALSLKLIQDNQVPLTASIIDVGGGASTLVDDLLDAGYADLTILDLSEVALSKAKQRLGNRGQHVNWVVANIVNATLPEQQFDVWHDRAVFHFLTSENDRQTYVEAVMRAVKPGGLVIVATFAEDGPTMCSGLPVQRYSAEELHDEFGQSFQLLGHELEAHHTPNGGEQKFVYCFCRKV